MDPAVPLLPAEDEAAPPPDILVELPLELLAAFPWGGSTGRPPGLVMIWGSVTVAFLSTDTVKDLLSKAEFGNCTVDRICPNSTCWIGP